MFSEPLNPPTLSGAESTAKIIRRWLIDEKKTRSGLLGVNNTLQVVSVRTFQHELSQPALNFALGEAVQASATGVVAYAVSNANHVPFDLRVIRKFASMCESLDVTLLDAMIYSPSGWQSARQQNLL